MAIGLVNGARGCLPARALDDLHARHQRRGAGLMVFHTGGFSPRDAVMPLMRELAVGRSFPASPNPLLIVWARSAPPRCSCCPHHLGRADLRHRQPRARGVTLGRGHAKDRCSSASSSPAVLRPSAASCWPAVQRCPGDGRSLSPAVRSPRSCSAALRPGGRGTYLGTVAGVHPDHTAAVDPVGVQPRKPGDRVKMLGKHQADRLRCW